MPNFIVSWDIRPCLFPPHPLLLTLTHYFQVFCVAISIISMESVILVVPRFYRISELCLFDWLFVVLVEFILPLLRLIRFSILLSSILFVLSIVVYFHFIVYLLFAIFLQIWWNLLHYAHSLHPFSSLPIYSVILFATTPPQSLINQILPIFATILTFICSLSLLCCLFGCYWVRSFIHLEDSFILSFIIYSQLILFSIVFHTILFSVLFSIKHSILFSIEQSLFVTFAIYFVIPTITFSALPPSTPLSFAFVTSPSFPSPSFLSACCSSASRLHPHSPFQIHDHLCQTYHLHWVLECLNLGDLHLGLDTDSNLWLIISFIVKFTLLWYSVSSSHSWLHCSHLPPEVYLALNMYRSSARKTNQQICTAFLPQINSQYPFQA